MPPFLGHILLLILLTITLFPPIFAHDTHRRNTRRSSSNSPKCEKITATHCLDIGYNFTRYPNFAGDESGVSALEDFATFEPLISVKCSEQLKFFLCSVYFPMCTEKVPIPIGPCRPLCEQVRDSCINVLKEFGFPWPASLNCTKFAAVNNHEHMCMGGAAMAEGDAEEEHSADEGPVTETRVWDEGPSYFSLGAERDVNYAEELRKYVLPGHKCALPTAMVYMNKTGQCVPHCSSSHGYSVSDLTSAKIALVIASALSSGLTCVCLLVVVLRGRRGDSSKSRGKPSTPVDKCLFFCAFSFALSALLHLFSVLQKDKIACTHYLGHDLFVVSGMPHVPCTLMATVTYYFGTAARVWWLALGCSWRWSLRQHSRLETFLFRCHCFAWAMPLVLCTLALMAQAVQADPLSGVCLVGGANRHQHQVFVSGRDGITLLASLLILLSGCLSATTKDPSEYGVGKPKGLFSTKGLVISILYPLAAFLWLVASAHHLFSIGNHASQHQPKRAQGGWGILAACKLLADGSLGILLGAAYFVHILHDCWGDLSEEEDGIHQHKTQRQTTSKPIGQQPPTMPTTAGSVHPQQQCFGGTIPSYRTVSNGGRTVNGHTYQPIGQVNQAATMMTNSLESNNSSSMALPPPPPPLSALPRLA